MIQPRGEAHLREGQAPCGGVPPVSIVLAARPAAYVEGLVAFREGRVADWIGSFATAAARAALMSIDLADQVAALQATWRERAGRPRAGSAAS